MNTSVQFLLSQCTSFDSKNSLGRHFDELFRCIYSQTLASSLLSSQILYAFLLLTIFAEHEQLTYCNQHIHIVKSYFLEILSVGQ